jgi:hypothetical protein
MTNLPNVIVREMEIHAASNKLRAATYGRGIWETVIPPVIGINPIGGSIPENYFLGQNYPNPFNPSTIIRFGLPKSSHVSIKIYNILAKEVRELVNSDIDAGKKSVLWNGKDNSGSLLSSGIYIYELRAGDFRDSKKMILLK